MFWKLFGRDTQKSPAHELGQKLFQQGVTAASEYRTAEAIALYTKSFETSSNPAPLINRAKLYRFRLLFPEAIRDLEMAARLDKRQGNEFSIPLEKELKECRFLAQHRLGDKRELFISDLREKGYDYVTGRILDTVFEGDGQLLGYHMINEVDNVKKFENVSHFPAVMSLAANWMKDQNMIDQALADQEICEEYQDKLTIFETMIGVYDYEDMAKLRDTMVRKIWCLLNPSSLIQAPWEVSLRNPVS